MATEIWGNIGSGNGLLPDGTKPLSEPMLTFHHLIPVTYMERQFHQRYLNHQSLKSVWKLHTQNFIEIPQGPMSLLTIDVWNEYNALISHNILSGDVIKRYSISWKQLFLLFLIVSHLNALQYNTLLSFIFFYVSNRALFFTSVLKFYIDAVLTLSMTMCKALIDVEYKPDYELAKYTPYLTIAVGFVSWRFE